MICRLLSYDMLFVTKSVAHDKKFLLSKIIQDSNLTRLECILVQISVQDKVMIDYPN